MATVELRTVSVMKTHSYGARHKRRDELNDIEAHNETALVVLQAKKLVSFPEWRGASVEVDAADPKKPSVTVTHSSGAIARFGAAARERARRFTYGGSK